LFSPLVAGDRASAAGPTTAMNSSPVTVARQAMATRFEIALFGDDPAHLRAAAEEALAEVQRVETLLNWRQPASPAALINDRASHEPVRVNGELFALLARCRELSRLSGGAFDITLGPLIRAWEGHAAGRSQVNEAVITAARGQCGMHFLQLDPVHQTVRFTRAGMRLEFGAVGKGYALELAAEILRDAGIHSALLHGGTSTVYAIGHPPGATHWKIAVEYPPGESAGEPLPTLAVVELRDTAMSVSAVWGRIFRIGRDSYGHVIDPRTGNPTQRALLSIYVGDSATESDALSTALLTDGTPAVERFLDLRPDARTLVLSANGPPGQYQIVSNGIAWHPPPGINPLVSP